MELAKRFTPDIILMDVKMPGMDGIKAGNLIKEFLPKTKIIVISLMMILPMPALLKFEQPTI